MRGFWWLRWFGWLGWWWGGREVELVKGVRVVEVVWVGG